MAHLTIGKKMNQFSIERIATIALIAFISVQAQSNLPAGFTSTTVTSNLSWPTRFALAPDGRIFVLEQAGNVRIIKNNQLLSSPFVTVNTNKDIISNTEEGLLGIAMDPNFQNNGYIYLYYTVMSPMHQRISRFKANGDIADAAAGETILLETENGGCHCGGSLEFGPDGKLYIGTGDSYNGPNSQSPTSLKGKILRMNPVPDPEAQIPADNPFYNQYTGKYRLIWAMGLRNPFSMAFQAGTGRLFINDVGLQSFEEINEGKAGRNFGWPFTEGTFSTAQYPQYTLPVLAYPRTGNFHTTGTDLVAGVFYNPTTPQFPSIYIGKYFFVDYGWDSWIRTIDPDNTTTSNSFVAAKTQGDYLDVRVSADGYLYYLIRKNIGSLIRVGYGSSNLSPSPSNSNSFKCTVQSDHRSVHFSIPSLLKEGKAIRIKITSINGKQIWISPIIGSKEKSYVWNHTTEKRGLYIAQLLVNHTQYAKQIISLY